jgi:hypothetical protein
MPPSKMECDTECMASRYGLGDFEITQKRVLEFGSSCKMEMGAVIICVCTSRTARCRVEGQRIWYQASLGVSSGIYFSLRVIAAA